MTRSAPLLLAAAMLMGCASQPPVPLQYAASYRAMRPATAPPRPRVVAANPDPGRSERVAAQERALSGLMPYSSEWWTVRNQIEAEEDRRLNAKLVICNGCLAPSGPVEHTGSLSQHGSR